MTNTQNPPIEKKAGCIAFATMILGDKWTPHILSALYTRDLRFSELEDIVTGITPRTLSAKLELLTEHSITNRQAYAEVPPRVVYSLTDQGKDLIPILRSMADWGAKYS
ncbi:MAG: helix-turn-helix transcriptional regulator [bacterium]|nr:helix-turn-helix transcriptional regulator [bacterium]